MKPFPLLMFSGGVILLPSLLIDIQELSAVQQNIKHERFSNLSTLYLKQHDGWWLLSLGNNLYFFFSCTWKKICFFDSVIWGILVQEFYHKSSPPSQSNIILWQPLPLGMLLCKLHELTCMTTFLNVLKMAIIRFLVDLSLQFSSYVKRDWTLKNWLTDWLAVALLPQPILPTRNSVQRTGLWWIRSSCFNLLKAGKSSSRFCFVQVCIKHTQVCWDTSGIVILSLIVL